jgi:hypothetical protein
MLPAQATVFSFAGGLSPCAEVGPFGGGPTDNVGLDGVAGHAHDDAGGPPPPDDDPCDSRSGQPGSPHSGLFSASYDDVSKLFSFEFSYTGLSNPPVGNLLFDGNPFADWHIHLGDPGENGAVLIAGGLLAPPSADSNPLVDSLVITPAATSVVGLSVADFEAVLKAGGFYINVHSDAYRQGELRAQILQVVPEPATLAVLGAGLIALAWRRRSAA